MKYSKEILACLFFTFAVFFAIGQKNDRNYAGNSYHVTHLGLEEGLSQGEAYQFLKDVNGFLWIGTGNGLNRFDGKSFKIYYHDPKNSNSVIGDDCIIGMGSIILDRAEIGRGSIVGAGALVTPGTIVPPGSMVMGAPARVKRPITEDERAWIASSAQHYVELTRRYLAGD